MVLRDAYLDGKEQREARKGAPQETKGCWLSSGVKTGKGRTQGDCAGAGQGHLLDSGVVI